MRNMALIFMMSNIKEATAVAEKVIQLSKRNGLWTR